MSAKPKLRLVGVQVRPEFVLDDGEALVPLVTEQPLAQYVDAKHWPNYPQEGFLEAQKALEAMLAEQAKPEKVKREAAQRKKPSQRKK